jgi:hypothetical protein
MRQASFRTGDSLIRKLAPKGEVSDSSYQLRMPNPHAVSWRTYMTYVHAAGTWSWFGTVALMILMRALATLQQVRCPNV